MTFSHGDIPKLHSSQNWNKVDCWYGVVHLGKFKRDHHDSTVSGGSLYNYRRNDFKWPCCFQLGGWESFSVDPKVHLLDDYPNLDKPNIDNSIG